MPLPHLALLVLAVIVLAAATVALFAWVGPVAGLGLPALIVAGLLLRLWLGRAR
jgi:hypothetical protein